MVKHIVVWTMKPEATAEQKQEMKLRLMALNGKIPQLLVIDVGIDEVSGTMSLYSEFALRKVWLFIRCIRSIRRLSAS